MLRKFFKHPFLLPRLLVWAVMFMPIFFILSLFIPAYFSAEKRFESIYADLSHAPYLPIKVFSEDGKLLGEIWAEGKCAEISYEALPEALVETIVLEDSNYWVHNGIGLPFYSMYMRYSTITQVLAKNRFRRNFLDVRFFFPLLIEKYFTKEEILTIFLNEHEIESLTQKYFHKTTSTLNLQEIALFTATLRKRHPIKYGEENTSLWYIRNKQLDRMAEHNIYPSAWKDSLKSLPLVVYPEKPNYLTDSIN